MMIHGLQHAPSREADETDRREREIEAACINLSGRSCKAKKNAGWPIDVCSAQPRIENGLPIGIE